MQTKEGLIVAQRHIHMTLADASRLGVKNGDIVDIKDLAGHLFARGRAAFSADEVELACGKTREVLERNRLLAALTQRPLVHRDELVVFE